MKRFAVAALVLMPACACPVCQTSTGIEDLQRRGAATTCFSTSSDIADGVISRAERREDLRVVAADDDVIAAPASFTACAAALPVRLELVDEFNDDRLWFAVDATVDGVSLLPATLVADAGVVDLFVQQVRDGRADSDEVVLRIDGRTVLALATNADPVDAFVDAPVDISVGDDVGGEGCSARPLPLVFDDDSGPHVVANGGSVDLVVAGRALRGTNLFSATTGGAGCDDAAASTVGWVVVTR